MAVRLPEDIHLCQGSGPSYKVVQQVFLADCLAWGDRKTEKEEAESGPICLSPLLNDRMRWEEEDASCLPF